MKRLLAVILTVAVSAASAETKVGIIGLDTGHVVKFTKRDLPGDIIAAQKAALYRAAAKKGNPDALVTFNPGVRKRNASESQREQFRRVREEMGR